MAFKETKVATRLLAGFGAILLASILMGSLCVLAMARLAATSTRLFNHPFTVSLAVAEVKCEVLNNQKLLTRLVHTSDPVAMEKLASTVDLHTREVDQKMALIRERYLGPVQDVEETARSLQKWRLARQETIALMRGRHFQEAIARSEGEDERLATTVMAEIQDLANFASARAARFRLEAERQSTLAMRTVWLTLVAMTCLCLVAVGLIIRSLGHSLRTALQCLQVLVEGGRERVRATERIAAGDLSVELQPSLALGLDLERLATDDLGRLMAGMVSLSGSQVALDDSFRKMTQALRRVREGEQRADWLRTALAGLDALLRGDQEPAQLADQVLTYLATTLAAGSGALYLFQEGSEQLERVALFAGSGTLTPPMNIRLGEGVLGQAAKQGQPILLDEVPAGYLAIASALGAGAPSSVIACHFLHDGKLIGALELGSFTPFSPADREFLAEAMEALAVSLAVNLGRHRVQALLAHSQRQEEELRVQQEELQQTNEELEERAQLLEQQREGLRLKTAEVERVSAFKSEFLANMSHELRTPLNSLMILSRILQDNPEGNLSPRQVQFAGTIHGAGKDLLELINDILDLSKIEAGRMEYSNEEVALQDLLLPMGATFGPMAEQKGLRFETHTGAGMPLSLHTDLQRCGQILKNLLANAIKFTPAGTVTLRAYRPDPVENPLPVPAIALAVEDTGIGVARSQQEAVFQAFHQADGTASRKFGGTGLGLSISRQLARGLGGELLLASAEGAGTVVTLYLPAAAQASPAAPVAAAPRPSLAQPLSRAEAGPLPPAAIPDDRDRLSPGMTSILIIEDDLRLAGVLVDLVRERGLAALAAADGPGGLALAEGLAPSAIILDVMLPGMDGWGVMQRLTDNPHTRHIPVHFLTCLEERQKAMAMGAIGFITKPVAPEELAAVLATIEASVSRNLKRLLIVEDDPTEASALQELLRDNAITIQVALTGAEAIQILGRETIDCIVLDLGLSDMSGFDLLEHIHGLDERRRTPVIIHSGRDLTREDELRLQRYAESIIIKGAKSPERLLNEVTLFLHVLESSLPMDKQRMIRSSLESETVFAGRTVLIADDDMRNVFALSSLLTAKRMIVLEAENGREALNRIQEHPEVDLVLMDIMMPEMDGYEAIRSIRADPRFARLPIIALTAKAMKGDREACLKAGATDYIPKPIDQERLLSLLRVWLYNQL